MYQTTIATANPRNHNRSSNCPTAWPAWQAIRPLRPTRSIPRRAAVAGLRCHDRRQESFDRRAVSQPNRYEFVRVRPGDEWRIETGVFEDKANRDVYLVQRNLWGGLSGEVCPACLFLTVNRQGDVFLWPCKLPGEGGRTNTWNDSAVAAARLAESRWVRVVSNQPASMYDTLEAAAELSEPAWPELSFQEILRLCFQSRFITTIDHPVIRRFAGAGVMDALQGFREIWLVDFAVSPAGR